MKDTQYIKMCREVKHLLWNPHIVFPFGALFIKDCNMFSINWSGTWADLPEDVIPLWSQNQLQGMVDWVKWKRKAQTILISACPVYDKFYPAMVILTSQNEVIWCSDDSIRTWNQLWLALVMWILFKNNEN